MLSYCPWHLLIRVWQAVCLEWVFCCDCLTVDCTCSVFWDGHQSRAVAAKSISSSICGWLRPLGAKVRKRLVWGSAKWWGITRGRNASSSLGRTIKNTWNWPLNRPGDEQVHRSLKLGLYEKPLQFKYFVYKEFEWLLQEKVGKQTREGERLQDRRFLR